MAVPESIIIVGCSGQGLSIALALSYSYPMVKVTVIDKQSPKITNEFSPSTVCVLKNDYMDHIGLNSALEAQQAILRDSDLRRYVYPRGIVRAHDSSDPESSKDWQTSFDTIKYLEQKAFREHSETTTGSVEHFHSHKALFAHLHHGKTEPPSSSNHWKESYLYPAGAIVDFDQLVMVLYQRCQRQSNIKFIFGHAIQSILLEGKKAKGVRLLDNSDFLAGLVFWAPDTTSSALLSLLPGVDVSGHDVVWLKPSDDLTEKYKDIPVLINQSTGITIFPPMNGLFKCLRRSTGYKNTVATTNPLTGEQSTFTVPLESSWKVPLDAENMIRKALGELIPEFEQEPLARSALSWLIETPSGNPVVDFHPEIGNLFISVLGSDNSIFMPILGEKVVKLIDRTHSSVLLSAWKFPRLEKGLQGSILRETRYYKPIIIVGAGVFGLTSALHLARRGYQNITIFDSEPYDENAYGSSKAASADENKVIRASYGEQKLY
jgi:sarcosine oxidase/L-pipecolate oxidase